MAYRVFRFMYSDGGLHRTYRVFRLMMEGYIGHIGCSGFMYSDGGIYMAYRVLKLMYSDGGL